MEEEDLYHGKGFIKDEELLEVVLLAEGSASCSPTLVKDGGTLPRRSRLGVNSDFEPLLLAVTRSNLGPRSDADFLGPSPENFHMSSGKNQVALCTAMTWRRRCGGSVPTGGLLYDADIAAVSNNHSAVMYSRTNEDTGQRSNAALIL